MPKDRVIKIPNATSATRDDSLDLSGARPKHVVRALDLDAVDAALAHRDRLRGRVALHTDGIAGRVIRFPKDSLCSCWDPSSTRRVVFFLEDSALARCLDATSDRAFLLELGYPGEFIDGELAAGQRFELAYFERQHAPMEFVLPATWGNLAKVIEAGYGPEVGSRVFHVIDDLEGSSFHEIERSAGASLREARATNHPCHINAPRLTTISMDRLRPWHVRYFLALCCNVNPLFAGDGMTRTESGAIGVPELVGLNGPLDSVRDLRRVALSPSSAQLLFDETAIKAAG